MEQGIVWIWTALQTASPVAAAICFLAMLKAWRDLADERQERRDCQKQAADLLERTIRALTDTRVAVDASTRMGEASHTAVSSLREIVNALRETVARNGPRGGR